MFRDDSGQSMVEAALVLPLLLLVLVGLLDTARIYATTSAVTNAAREGALYAARDPHATSDKVRGRVCGELGYTTCPASIRLCYATRERTVSCDAGFGGAPACTGYGDLCLGVRYDLELVSGSLAQRFMRVNPVAIRGAATIAGQAVGR